MVRIIFDTNGIPYVTAFLHLKLVLDCTIGAMWYTYVDRMS